MASQTPARALARERRRSSDEDLEAFWQSLPVGRAQAKLARDIAIELGWFQLDVDDSEDLAVEAAKRRVRLAAERAAGERRLFASDDAGYWRPATEDMERLRQVAARYVAMGTRTLARGRELEAAINAHLHQGRLL